MTEQRKRRCESCAWFESYGADSADDRTDGECRYNPEPLLKQDDYWCRCWETKTPPGDVYVHPDGSVQISGVGAQPNLEDLLASTPRDVTRPMGVGQLDRPDVKAEEEAKNARIRARVDQLQRNWRTDDEILAGVVPAKPPGVVPVNRPDNTRTGLAGQGGRLSKPMPGPGKIIVMHADRLTLPRDAHCPVCDAIGNDDCDFDKARSLFDTDPVAKLETAAQFCKRMTAAFGADVRKWLA